MGATGTGAIVVTGGTGTLSANASNGVIDIIELTAATFTAIDLTVADTNQATDHSVVLVTDSDIAV